MADQQQRCSIRKKDQPYILVESPRGRSRPRPKSGPVEPPTPETAGLLRSDVNRRRSNTWSSKKSPTRVTRVAEKERISASTPPVSPRRSSKIRIVVQRHGGPKDVKSSNVSKLQNTRERSQSVPNIVADNPSELRKTATTRGATSRIPFPTLQLNINPMEAFEFLLPNELRGDGGDVDGQGLNELKRLVAHNTKVMERRLARIEENQAYLMWKYQSMTEQLKKKKKEQADARDQLYRKSEAATAKENDADREKVQVTPAEDSSAPEEVEPTKEEPKLDQKPSAMDSILPAMRQERAASIARRKQRPISNLALDLEYKNKSEERSTPPRSSSPIAEAPAEIPASSVIISPDEVKLEIEEEENEIIKEKGSPTVTKKQKIEEQEEVKRQEEKEEEEKSEEMVNDEIKEEPKDDTDGAKEEKDDFDLPALPASTKKLEHVTKGRPRPTRRVARKPVVRDTEMDGGVDDFFSTSVRNTDFEKVPTLAEEKKEAESEVKEKTPKRPIGVGLPGMGSITPEMLRRRNKHTVAEEKPKEEDKAPESPKEKKDENGEEEEDGKPKTPPAVKKRPPGAMGLPGMGFGGNVLAEMKLKKLNKSKSPEPSHDDSKPKDSKNDSEHAPVPFGRSMLKKTNHVTTGPVAEKSEPNDNNNNNGKDRTNLRSPPNRWKSKSFEKVERPEVTVKPTTKSPLAPPKPSPPPATNKPGRGGVLPPLPSKPKPAALRPDSELRGGRARPMSEFIDPKHVPSKVKLRAASWGKKASDSDDKK